MPKRLMRSGLALLLLLGSCAAPLSVDRLSTPDSYKRLNRSALMGDMLSETTLIALRRQGLLDAWRADQDDAIARFRAAVVGQPAKWPELFALAELSYLQGERRKSQQDFLAAAIYAFAYLFPGAGGDRPSPYDPRFRQACDIYNLGLTEGFTPADKSPISLVSGSRSLPFGRIKLDVDQETLRWAGRNLVAFQPTANLDVKGLQNIYRDPGLGAPLAALTEAGSAQTTGFQVAARLRVPTNMMLVMDAPRQQIAQPLLRGELLVHSIYDPDGVQLDRKPVPLEYDQTAARALSLSETKAWANEYEGFLNGGLLDRAPTLLTAIEPHQRGRMPVILIHGTASSPFRWSDLVNDLLEDPEIRNHFEFWFFSYASGNPIPYSAFRLRRSIEDAIRDLGGEEADPALGRMTIIGHSQGGLLAKMLVINPGDRLWEGISTRPLASLQLTDASRDLLRESLMPRQLPEVQRVVFVATPHRGSYVAAFSLIQLVGRLVTLPLSVTQAAKEVLTGNGDNVIMGRNTRLGSIYGMSPGSTFLKSLAAIPVAPGVHVHSIIPVQTEGPVTQGSDGVVRYSSAHIDGVDSELVVRSGHSTQSNPATVAEIRRILLLQLAASMAQTPPSATRAAAH